MSGQSNKMRLSIVLLALALPGCAAQGFPAAPPAQAQASFHAVIRLPSEEPAVIGSLRVLPPPEYDHPYTGKLTIERSPSQEFIRSKCGPTTFPYHLGCAFLQPAGCFILMADDAYIRSKGWTPEIVLRHEEAHCGGWPSHHPGARAP